MLINEITNRINFDLAGETLSNDEVVYYVDAVIDDINEKLSSKYPVLSDWGAFVDVNNDQEFPEIIYTADNYNPFPEKYIRSVVVKGAAIKYYVNNEEGEDIGDAYKQEYAKNLFMMLRDFIHQVPANFVEDNISGYLQMEPYNTEGVSGVEIDGSNIIL